MSLMFDAAYSPNLAACKAAGGIAVSHYLTGNYASTSPQPAATRAAGMGAVLNYEQTINEEVGASRIAGQDIARRAIAGVDPACPRDRTVKIYFSVDTDVVLSNIAACDEAFRGIGDILHPAGFLVGIYGEGALIDRLRSLGLVDGKQWLSESTSFPGFNVHDSNIAMVQNHDANGNWLNSPVSGTDVNTILDPNEVGAWWAPGQTFGDVPLTETEWARLTSIVNGAVMRLGEALITGKGNAVVNQNDCPDVADGVGLRGHIAAVATAPVQVDPTALAQAIASHVTLAAR